MAYNYKVSAYTQSGRKLTTFIDAPIPLGLDLARQKGVGQLEHKYGKGLIKQCNITVAYCRGEHHV